MDGGTNIIGEMDPGGGRHSRSAGANAWTPAVPSRPAYGKHAADGVPAQRDRRTTAAGAETTHEQGAAGTELLPNLRPSKHEAARGQEPEPVPVLEPIEYDKDPEPDPLADTDSFGLSKFNLGSVPASVTPPRSWRKAAWFSVAASGAALAALVAMAGTFVGKGHRTVVDALPGLPSAPLPTTEVAPDQGHGKHAKRESEEHGKTDRRTTTVVDPNNGAFGTSAIGQQPPPGSGPVGQQGPNSADPSSAASGSAADPASGVPSGGAGPPASSTHVSARPLPPPQQDPEVEMGSENLFAKASGKTADPERASTTSQSFYDAVADDPDAALAYADDSMSSSQRSAIRSRYAGVDYVRVSHRYVDPNQCTTRNTMTLYYSDGRSEQVTRTLKFTPGEKPRIQAEY